MVIYTIIQLFS